MRMIELDAILGLATASIAEPYFLLPIDGGPAIYRERVYCYELYHRMRQHWPNRPDYFCLGGEIDKRNHPILAALEAANCSPDLLVHKPGDMAGNHAIIEIKPAGSGQQPLPRGGIRKDLDTLSRFTQQVKYQRGIYLVYGSRAIDQVARIETCFHDLGYLGRLNCGFTRLPRKPPSKPRSLKGDEPTATSCGVPGTYHSHFHRKAMPPPVHVPATTQLLQELRRGYIDSGEIAAHLQPNGIAILSDFLSNWGNIERFYSTYYGPQFPPTVLCGLNPGRHGAGKTGVPFLDFISLSKLLSGVNRSDTERSAQFFFKIVSHFGAKAFFRSFYVTNVSWVGFIKAGKNVNYDDDLPSQAIDFIHRMLTSEMEVVRPKRIISLSKSVHRTITDLFGGTVDTRVCLPHPNWCAFPNKEVASKSAYLNALTPLLVH